MIAPVVAFDSRGRLSLRSRIEKNGVQAPAAYSVSFGSNQTVILTPLKAAA